MEIDAKKWDARVGEATGWCHFWQSAEWAAAQDHTAWQPILTEVDLGQSKYPIAIYCRSVPSIGDLYVASKIATLQVEQVKAFTAGLTQIASRGIAVKIDIDQLYDEKVHQALLKQGWRRTPSPNYSDTVLVDLGLGEEELLKSFKKSARWEIKTGESRGVKVDRVPVTPENMAIVYDLLSETYRRADFFTRSRHYTESYWQSFDANEHGSMYIARLKGKPLSAAYVIHIGDRAHYKDGASIRIKPDVFASRVMQWGIMRDLMGRGIKTYDLGGVWREGSATSGVTLFKTGFGEQVQTQWGYELPLSNWRYQLWKKAGERMALKYSSTVRKQVWY